MSTRKPKSLKKDIKKGTSDSLRVLYDPDLSQNLTTSSTGKAFPPNGEVIRFVLVILIWCSKTLEWFATGTSNCSYTFMFQRVTSKNLSASEVFHSLGFRTTKHRWPDYVYNFLICTLWFGWCGLRICQLGDLSTRIPDTQEYKLLSITIRDIN